MVRRATGSGWAAQAKGDRVKREQEIDRVNWTVDQAVRVRAASDLRRQIVLERSEYRLAPVPDIEISVWMR